MRAGTLKLTITSPVQSWTEPLTLTDVKTYLRIPLAIDDPARDRELEVFIAAAREQAEIIQNRDLVRKQWTLSLDDFDRDEIELRDELVSVESVVYKNSGGTDATLVENTHFIKDVARRPGIIRPVYGGSWPTFTAWPTSAVTIQFTSGIASTDAFWNDSGKRIKVGMLMLISMWDNNRLPFEAGASAIQEYPFAVNMLLGAGALERAICA